VCFGQPVYVLATFEDQGAAILQFFKVLAVDNVVKIPTHYCKNCMKFDSTGKK
jgi:hypothetical protein